MPRPRRTKNASSDARVVTSSDIQHAPSAKTRTTKSIAPTRSTRGRPRMFRRSDSVEEIDSSVPDKRSIKKTTRVQGAKNATKGGSTKRKPTLTIDDDIEENETSALDALRSRIGGSAKSKGKRRRPLHDELVGSDETEPPAPTADMPLLRSPADARVASTPMRPSSTGRDRTPEIQPNTDDDLYGLSPAGKAAQARIEARRNSIVVPPPSAMKVHGTPGMETSLLALANFKRRPRQPSMIRMVQQTSELGQDDEDLYLSANLEADLDDTIRSFESFVPQDESTPLHFGKQMERSLVSLAGGPSSPSANNAQTSSSRKRMFDEIDPTEVVEIPESIAPGSSPASSERIESMRFSRSPSLPEERVIPSTEEQDLVNADPQSQSDIMAPPRSSSEPGSPKRQKTSGAKKSQMGKKATKELPKISTAQLQSLLPKPRRKPGARLRKQAGVYEVRSDEEVDTTFDLPSDDDEEAPRTSTRRRALSLATSKTIKTPLGKRDANKKISAKKALAAKAAAEHKRTYGRPKTIGKENADASAILSSEVEDDDTVEIGNVEGAQGRIKVGKSRELQQAKNKFKAVDDWEMEFESVDLGGGDSSPWR